MTIAFLLSIIVSLPSTSAETKDPAIIGFDFENGLSINESISLSGSIESDTFPDSVIWSIESDPSTMVQLYDNQINDSLQETQSQSGRMTWSWQANLEVEWSHCTCYFTITVIIGEYSWSETRVLFIGDTLRSGLLIDSPVDGDWTHESIVVTGWSSHPTVWADSETRFFTYPATNPVQSCSEEGDSDMTQLLSVISSEGDYSSTINISALEDGWYSLYVENYDPSRVAFAQQCVGIRVNNAPPGIVINGEPYHIESLGEITFDASASDDLYWGREEMEYMWVLRKPSHNGQTPIDIEFGGSTYSLSANSGGDYSLTLRLTDSGGVSSTSVFQFVIENQKPNAAGSISGIPIIDGDTIRLSDSDEWELDASDSSDSENDISSLRCIWKIDYEPIFEGCQRSLTWASEIESDSCILTLEVIDNDETFSSISVILIHPDSTEPLPYSLIVLLVSALFLISAIFLRYRSSDDSTGIPSWDSDK